MKETMIKKRRSIAAFAVIWLLLLILFIKIASSYNRSPDNSDISFEAFSANAAVLENEDRVGANIWLKQTIHGLDGINYRYVIETDCPRWDFETRYMTDAPIEWIDETSAVEVMIRDIQIRYNNRIYASGQYYTVPILGGISSENITLDEWKTNLSKQAYQTYVSETDKSQRVTVIYTILLYLAITLFIVVIVAVYRLYKADRKKRTTNFSEW